MARQRNRNASGTPVSAIQSSPTPAQSPAPQTAPIAATPPQPTNFYYVVIFQTGHESDRFGMVNRYVLHRIKTELNEKVTTQAASNVIDVWLDSPGGDANAAYKIFLELQSRCARLRCVIPDYAKSAATLFAIGCDEIYMNAASELGPLDMQIEHPDREGRRVSALNVAQALQFLGEFALNYSTTGTTSILKLTGLPRVDVLDRVLKFTADLLQPMVQKLDPNLVHRAKNQLRITQDYAERMLANRRLAPQDRAHIRDGYAAELAKNLVTAYPAHEFVIGTSEARSLRLPVRNADEYNKWDEASGLHHIYRTNLWETIFSHKVPNSVVKVITTAELDAEEAENENTTIE